VANAITDTAQPHPRPISPNPSFQTHQSSLQRNYTTPRIQFSPLVSRRDIPSATPPITRSPYDSITRTPPKISPKKKTTSLIQKPTCDPHPFNSINNEVASDSITRVPLKISHTQKKNCAGTKNYPLAEYSSTQELIPSGHTIGRNSLHPNQQYRIAPPKALLRSRLGEGTENPQTQEPKISPQENPDSNRTDRPAKRRTWGSGSWALTAASSGFLGGRGGSCAAHGTGE
jgi:hypothetical protein